MSLRLKKFDIKNITQDSVILFIGKRCTGKSWLVRDLLYHNRKMPIGTVISGTESANSFYSSIIPSIFIHGEYTEKIISSVLKRQRLALKKMKSEFAKTGHTSINPSAFLILDDCLYDNSWVRSKNIRSMFMNGRHYKLMFILTMQYALGIPPNLRTNVDYIFILRENIVQNRKRLYDNYAGMFPTFDMFCQVMDQCTENYECLVVHNNAKSNKLEDQVFWYKAKQCPSFQMGDSQFWEYARRHKKKEDYDDEEEPNMIFKRKSKNTFRVQKY